MGAHSGKLRCAVSWSARIRGRCFCDLAVPDCLALAGVGDPIQAGAGAESGFTARAATGSGDGRRRNIYRRAFYCGVYGWRGRGASRNLGYCAGYGDFRVFRFRADTAEALKGRGLCRAKALYYNKSSGICPGAEVCAPERPTRFKRDSK
jgi:hypothetical protein